MIPLLRLYALVFFLVYLLLSSSPFSHFFFCFVLDLSPVFAGHGVSPSTGGSKLRLSSLKFRGSPSLLRHLRARIFSHILDGYQFTIFPEMCFYDSSSPNLHVPALFEISVTRILATPFLQRLSMLPTIRPMRFIHRHLSNGGWGILLNPNVFSLSLMGFYGPCYCCWVLRMCSKLDGQRVGALCQDYIFSWAHRKFWDYALDFSKHPFYLSFSSFLKMCIPLERESTVLILAHLYHLSLCSLHYLSSHVLEEVSYLLDEIMLWVCTHKLWSSSLTNFGFLLEDVHMSTQRLMILPLLSVGTKPLLWLYWCLRIQLPILICYCRPFSQAKNLHKAGGCAYKSIISRVSKSTAFTGTRSFFPPSLPVTMSYPICRAAELSSTPSYYTSCRIFLAASTRVIDLNSRLHLYLGFFEFVSKHLSHRKLYGVLCDIHILPSLFEALSSTFIVKFPVFRAVVFIRLRGFTIVLKLIIF